MKEGAIVVPLILSLSGSWSGFQPVVTIRGLWVLTTPSSINRITAVIVYVIY